MMQPSDIDPVLLKYIEEEGLTAGEAALLRRWLEGYEDRGELLYRLRHDRAWVKANLARLQKLPIDPIWLQIETRLQSEGHWPPADQKAPRASPLTIVHPRTRPPRTYLFAAALVLVFAAGGTWLWWLSRHSASLAPAAHPPAIAYKTVSTPRAGQLALTLPDGTKVWLNNVSILRYPAEFSGPDRVVDLTGEAYFDVAKDPTRPFRVSIHRTTTAGAGSSIEVLGTSFNVMAYADEPAERTTLVDGSIRISHAGASVLLHPAEQSVLDDQGSLQVLSHVDTSEIIDWKNGYFHFDRASLPSVMRQLARWYDIDVTYQGQIPEQQYMGKIERNLPLSAVLKGLKNEQVHFKLEGRHLQVMP